MSTQAVRELISNICKLSADNPLTQQIKDMHALVYHLQTLDSMIGMARAKEATVSQIKKILYDGAGNDLLHTMICGPPGVGKTELAITLANIWNAMGSSNLVLVYLLLSARMIHIRH